MGRLASSYTRPSRESIARPFVLVICREIDSHEYARQIMQAAVDEKHDIIIIVIVYEGYPTIN